MSAKRVSPLSARLRHKFARYNAERHLAGYLYDRDPKHISAAWRDSPEPSCCSCAHSIGYDGIHLWCQCAALVVGMPCGSWERGAGCDERERCCYSLFAGASPEQAH